MPSSKTVSPRIVRAVRKLRHEGNTWKQVGETLGRSESWGMGLLKTYDGETGLRKEARKKTGAPRKTDETADFVMEALAENLREHTYQDIANVLRERQLADVCEKTVRVRLKKRGFRKTTAVLDTLTDAHKAQRVKWCTEMQNRLLEDPYYFQKWWISDEMRVSLDEKGKPKVKPNKFSLD